MAVVADDAMKVWVNLNWTPSNHVWASRSRQFIAEVDEDAEEEILAQEYEELQAAVNNLPPVQIPDEAAQPLGRGVLTLDTQF